MKKKSFILILLVFAFFFDQWAFAFRVDEHYNIPFSDVNKKWDGVDDSICFAACAANLIYWGWGADPEVLWKWFRKKYSYRVGGTIVEAMQLWLTEAYKNKNYTLSQINNAILSKVDTRYQLKEEYALFLTGSLLKGELVAIIVDYGPEKYKHILTIYGYTELDKSVLLLDAVDSDDKKTEIFKLHMFWMRDNWYLLGVTNGPDDYDMAIVSQIISIKSGILLKRDRTIIKLENQK